MPVGRDVKERVFLLKYHERKAIKQLAATARHTHELKGVGRRTVEKLVAGGLVEKAGSGGSDRARVTLSSQGRATYAALDELGWLPP